MALPTLPAQMKRGSKKSRRDVTVTIRVSAETKDQLEQIAERTNMSQATVLTMLIAAEHEQGTKRSKR